MFKFTFTVDKLKAAMPSIKAPDDWFTALSANLPKNGIDTSLRVSMFLAQTGHESNDYNVLEENLFYRAPTLLKVFPKYFKTLDEATQFARQPEKIANRVYANRLGNSTEASGDGYRYRGRGLIQLTGKANYSACSKALYNDDRLVSNPDLVSAKDGAIASACWFWNSRGLNTPSDAGDVVAATIKINGGQNGLDDRTARYARAVAALK